MSEFNRAVDDDTDWRPNGGDRIWFLMGPLGGVQLSFSRHRDASPGFGEWIGRAIHYHSPKPLFPGHRQRRGNCPYVPGSRCYQAGSLVPEDLPQEWLAAGRNDEVIWRVLELAYQRFFVDTTPQDYWTRISRVLSEVLGGDETSD